MLVTIRENGKVEPISRQPHHRHFDQWMRNLARTDFEGISEALNAHIETVGKGEIVTSSWIPGADWKDTPYEPIYHAVGDNWEMARFFFGLIVWNVVGDRPEVWSFGRYPRNPGEIIGLTYFRLHVPAANAA
jgi:hypothetical protein